MKKYPNWGEVEEAKEFPSLKAGGYIAYIKNVEDVIDKEYLKVSFDIAEGEFKDFYDDLYKSQNFWGGSFYRSYKESAISFFKGFTTAVEKSNPNYVFDFDEKKLKGKLIGIVLQEEEYIPQQGKHSGEVRTRLIVQEVRSVDEIRKENFKVKPKKTLSEHSSTLNQEKKEDTKFDINLDDIAF